MILVQVGVDPRGIASLRNIPRYVTDARKYDRQQEGALFKRRLRHASPVLTDFQESAGTATGHYFHQDLWAAKKIYSRRPSSHIDVGSRIDGFIAHLLTFMEVTVVDLRPLEQQIEGLHFERMDATTMGGFADDSIESLSSLHALEHFGLGRYGDPVDPDACFTAMRSLARVLRPGGRLYLSVPIGRERLEFNAHRIFRPRTVVEAVPQLELVSFSAVDEEGMLQLNAELERFDDAAYSCGLFEFTKP